MPIFRVKSVKIYTGQKKFTRIYPWDPWQISGMAMKLPFDASNDDDHHHEQQYDNVDDDDGDENNNLPASRWE